MLLHLEARLQPGSCLILVVAGLWRQRPRRRWTSKMGCRRLALSLVLVTLFSCGVQAQKPEKDDQPEQTSFGADVGPREFMRKPIEIPVAALEVLRDTLSMDRGTVNCLKKEDIAPEQVPASWFLASETHLDGPGEIDLIVQPNLPKIPPGGPPNVPEARCLLGANVGPFWVLRNTRGRYGLLLETYALGLEVLDSRANGYRDIQTVSSTAVTRTTLLYKMAVAQYQLAQKKTEP